MTDPEARIAYIEKRRSEGAKAIDVAIELSLTPAGLTNYMTRNGLKPWQRKGEKMPRKFSIPVGQVSLLKSLTPDQMEQLDKIAVGWGCETMSEAVIEILRDHLDEQAATR